MPAVLSALPACFFTTWRPFTGPGNKPPPPPPPGFFPRRKCAFISCFLVSIRRQTDQPVCIELWHFQLPAPRKVPCCLYLIQRRHLILKPTNFERGRIRPIWVSDLRKRPLIGVSRSLIYEQRTEPKPGARAHIALFQWRHPGLIRYNRNGKEPLGQ